MNTLHLICSQYISIKCGSPKELYSSSPKHTHTHTYTHAKEKGEKKKSLLFDNSEAGKSRELPPYV